MNRQRSFALILFVSLIMFLLSGCSSSKSPVYNTNTETEGFSLVHIPLPDGIALSTTQYCEDDRIFIGGFSLDGSPVFGCYLNGGFVDYDLPSGVEYVYACCTLENGSIILAGDYPQFWRDINDNTHINDSERKNLIIVVYDKDGAVVSKKELFDEQIGNQNFISIRFYDGYYYLLSTHGFFQIDSNGQVVNNLKSDNSKFISQCLTDDGITLCVYLSEADGGDNTTKLQHLNPDTFQLETIFSNNQEYISGIGYTDDGTYLINSDGTVMTLDQNSQIESLFSFSLLGSAQLDYAEIYQYNGGYVSSMRNQHSINWITYGKLTNDRQTLRLLATVNSPAIINLVDRFNQNNEQYVVTIEYVGDMSQEQLNALIASGNGPDIYAMIGMDMFENVSHSKVFEDLYPYLENYEIDNTNRLLQPLLDACIEDDNALYIIPIDFMIWSFCAQKDLLSSDQTDITNLLDIKSTNDAQAFSALMSRTDLWYWISNLYLNNHYNSVTNTFDFKTEEFTLLLESCIRVSDNQNSFDDSGIVHLEQIPGILRLQYLHNKYGTNYTLNTALGSAFSVQQSLAISSQSKNKDAAWQFVREALSSNFPQSSDLCLPATEERFNALIEQGINGVLWNLNDPIIITEYEKAELTNVLNGTSILLDEYPSVIQVMKEEADKFFAGAKNVEETVSAIQSRVNIIMAEKFG